LLHFPQFGVLIREQSGNPAWNNGLDYGSIFVISTGKEETVNDTLAISDQALSSQIFRTETFFSSKKKKKN
jgi:hypothetical protein